MRQNLLAAVCVVLGALTLGCPTPTPQPDAGTGTDAGVSFVACTGTTCDVTGDITSNYTFKTGNTYILKDLTYVTGAVLTIEPGVTVKADPRGALVVAKTSRLEAVGTAMQPIVFTSNAPNGMRGSSSGDWGGLVFLGNAAINDMGGIANAEGLPDEARNKYGGGTSPDNAHNCGTLKYVRVEFAGKPLSQDNELNGITLNACGSATTLDYVQVHRGVDDALEIFGGSVNIKHIVLTGFDDDGLDWDKGWTGKGQFIVIQATGDRGNHGIEADNNRSSRNAMPRSLPVLYNVTIIGRRPSTAPSEGPSRGMILREGTGAKLYNFIVMNHTDDGLRVDHTETAALWDVTNPTNGSLFVSNSLWWDNRAADAGFRDWRCSTDAGVGNPLNTMCDNMFDEKAALESQVLKNRVLFPELTAPLSEATPNFKPVATSPALISAQAAVPPSDMFFDNTATFVGAVGATDWTAGWTAYPTN
jgi:hypothetical protein